MTICNLPVFIKTMGWHYVWILEMKTDQNGLQTSGFSCAFAVTLEATKRWTSIIKQSHLNLLRKPADPLPPSQKMVFALVCPLIKTLCSVWLSVIFIRLFSPSRTSNSGSFPLNNNLLPACKQNRQGWLHVIRTHCSSSYAASSSGFII